MAINLASMVGHGTVRLHVMGMDNRPPTSAELTAMQALVDDALTSGACGFSTGLIYSPCVYSDTDELIELGRVARRHDSFMVYHMRYEGARVLDGMAEVFAATGAIAIVFGGACVLTTSGRHFELRFRDAALLTVVSWFAVPAFGALPLLAEPVDLSVVDAYFEFVSGMTTTGSTVMTGLDATPKSILLWRSTGQWIGGIGKSNDPLLRSYLYEAAGVLMTRLRRSCPLQQWALRIGWKRASIAVARKLAVILHAIWRDGTVFEWSTTEPAVA